MAIGQDPVVAGSEFRSVILFGANVASYKFALGQSLLEIAATGTEEVTLEELAVPFSRALCEHLKHVDTQGTSQQSRFLDACRYFNAGVINQTELVTATSYLGFRNVIDAFHIVDGSEGSVRFFVDERRGKTRGIRITEDMHALATSWQSPNLKGEVQGRWNLVERAWESKSKNEHLVVLYDVKRELLIPGLMNDRRPVTEARIALNGYQKGHCFYCNRQIVVGPNSTAPADVDHVFPHSLMGKGVPVDLDRVWNLVLACQECNRGVEGKGAQIPAVEYIELLARRNELLITSHHPLRETLIAQMGPTPGARRGLLQRVAVLSAELGFRSDWRPRLMEPPAMRK